MARIKKGIAMLLTMLMLFSTMSVVAFAEEKASIDDVVYNLGNQEIRVGYDVEQAEEAPWNYKLFNEDGSYTIQLEDNAFFPYEVQFKDLSAGSDAITAWFDTPDSEVQIGNHTFTVYSEQYDNTKLSQIGFWVGDEYVAAYPEPKSFTNLMMQPFSLLPLQEHRVSLDLSSYNRFQLENVKVSAILSGLTPEQEISDDARVVWTRLYNDDYEIVEQTDTINFTEMGNYISLELIVGSALQLDDTNIRYVVNVIQGDNLVVADTSIYKSVNDERLEVIPADSYGRTYAPGSSIKEYQYNYLTKADMSADKLYMGLTLNSTYNDLEETKVYNGFFTTVETAEAAVATNSELDVTELVLNKNMDEDGGGFEFNLQPGRTSYWQTFTFVFNDGEMKYVYPVDIYIVYSNGVYARSELYTEDSSYSGITYSSSSSSSNGIITYTYTLDKDYDADDIYYLRLQYRYGGSTSDSNRSYVTKAVVGHFDTEEDAAEEEDIKEMLFPVDTYAVGSGYAANYSGDGQNFTVFAEDEVYKLTIKAIDAPVIPIAPTSDFIPNPGSSDTYFRVNGANELQHVYVLPYEHDSYYDMGYQTVFYTEDVPLAELAPTFWGGDGVDVYAGNAGQAGALQESGITVNDFSAGPVQYAAAAEDGTSLKNYWVTFVKKETGGAKLFVNGINGEDEVKREVFFTSVHNNIHDIFIANVGDAPLTGLNVTLDNAQNVKLDPYWTVGGEKNDTLAAFTDLDYWADELNNIAKIRLLPDGEGEISGTLTISADDQEDVVITLTGNAGNPKLVTTDIPEAVKYVPYAVQILHNNKYSWNTVTLTHTSGKLPEGVTLKPNGELYGVPKETGTFPFIVQMTNSDTRLGGPSSQLYTLVVKENTSENVEASTDEGYDITERVPNTITSYQDYTFVSNGELDEFIDFWLNGTKLEEGTDYTKESGSTKITIRSQTFEKKADRRGTNTIAAEFRVNGDENNDLKTSAQNFQVKVGGGSSPSVPTPSPVPTPEPSPVPSPTPKPTPSPTSSPIPTPTPTLIPQTIITAPDPIVVKVELTGVAENGEIATELLADQVEVALADARKEKEDKANSPIIVELVLSETASNLQALTVSSAMEVIESFADVAALSLKINAGELGTITLNNKALKGILAEEGEKVSIHIAKDGRSAAIAITVDGVLLKHIDGGIKIALPGLAQGEVIILVKLDGEETIVKKSVVQGGNVYALLNGSGTVEVVNNSQNFKDVASTDWFKSAVLFVNSRELFVGINEENFDPNSPMSRAMLATVLYRLEDSNHEGMEKTFNDVLSNLWYSNGVAWASSTGIISGYADDSFGTNDSVTREQLAVILYRYANYVGVSTLERGNTQQFRDVRQISSWAEEAVRWAVGIGLIKGEGANLNPKGDATRAEVAAILMRFMNFMVK